MSRLYILNFFRGHYRAAEYSSTAYSLKIFVTNLHYHTECLGLDVLNGCVYAYIYIDLKAHYREFQNKITDGCWKEKGLNDVFDFMWLTK